MKQIVTPGAVKNDKSDVKISSKSLSKDLSTSFMKRKYYAMEIRKRVSTNKNPSFGMKKPSQSTNQTSSITVNSFVNQEPLANQYSIEDFDIIKPIGKGSFS